MINSLASMLSSSKKPKTRAHCEWSGHSYQTLGFKTEILPCCCRKTGSAAASHLKTKPDQLHSMLTVIWKPTIIMPEIMRECRERVSGLYTLNLVYF